MPEVQAGHLVLDPHHRLLGGHAAVADGGVQLVQGAEAHLLEDEGEHVLGGDGGQGEAHVLELRLEGGAAGGDVLLPPLLLEHWRILLRASLDLQIFIQSRLGPWADLEVMTSTMSPFFSGVSKVTMRPLTLAPVMWLPTAEWML